VYTHRNKKINPKFPLDIFSGTIEVHKRNKKDKDDLEDTDFNLTYETMDQKKAPLDTFTFSREEIEKEYGKLTINSCIELILDNPSFPIFDFEIFEVLIEQQPLVGEEVDPRKQASITQLQQKKDNKRSTFTHYFLDKDKAIDFSTEYIQKVDHRIKYNLSISKVPLFGVNSSVFKTDE